MTAVAKAKPKAKSLAKPKPQPVSSVDIEVQSPLWAAQPAAEQAVRDAIAAADLTLNIGRRSEYPPCR